jgi:hypothetical protein
MKNNLLIHELLVFVWSNLASQVDLTKLVKMTHKEMSTMTTVNKIVSAFLAILFLTGLLGIAPASAEGVLKTTPIEELSEEEHFERYES